MREVFHQSLEDVQSRLVEISELVIVAIDKATRAFSTSDVALAEEVIEEDEVMWHKPFRCLRNSFAVVVD